MRISDTLLPEFDQEMASTRKVLERCPESKFGWRPHAKSWTMAELATHVANLPDWANETLKKTRSITPRRTGHSRTNERRRDPARSCLPISIRM